MSRKFEGQIGSLESRRGPKLAYDLEFRKILREHPGLIKTAIDLTDKAIAEYNPESVNGMVFDKETGKWLIQTYTTVAKDSQGKPIVELTSSRPMDYDRGTILVPGEPIVDEKSGLSVTVLGRSNRENMGALKRKDVCDYFKMTLGEKSYFVKRSYVTVTPGFEEFHDTRMAEWLINNKDLIRVVQPKLGYQDAKESWYISEWEEIENAGFRPSGMFFNHDNYGKLITLPPDASDEEREAWAKEEEAIEKLRDELAEVLFDDRLHNDIDANLFYNPKTGKFIFLDVTHMDYSNPNKTLGNPIKNRGKL